MHYRGLDLNLLVVLDALLAEKNITRTGERIHLSQSATSGALARLRDFFKDDLLVQAGNKMVLTPLAEDLSQPVRTILLQIGLLINRVPDFVPATSTRRFRLMMSGYAASVLMPRVLPKIQREAPNITFEILFHTEHPAETLERGEVDLLVVPPEYSSKLHPLVPLFEDLYVCLAWKDNPEIGDHLSLSHYKTLGHVSVSLGGPQSRLIDEWLLSREGFERRIEIICATFDLLPRLVLGTTRIATLPERLATSYAAQFPLKIVATPVEFPPLREMVQWHQSRQTDTAILWLRNLLGNLTHSASGSPQ